MIWLGVYPQDVLAFRLTITLGEKLCGEVSIALQHGGAIILRGYPQLSEGQKRQLSEVVDAIVYI